MERGAGLLLLCVVILLGAGCTPPEPAGPAAPQPGRLRAGVAVVDLDAPIGTPSGGYGRPIPADDPGSTFAQVLPASRGLQSPLRARALALSNGVEGVVLLSVDLPLTTSTLRARAEAHARALGVDAPLVIAATHSHAAPARFFLSVYLEGTAKTNITAQAMDEYDAEIEDRLAKSLAAAAAQAWKQQVPAAIGHAEADGGDFNSDRRCQNDDLYGPDHRDRALTVLRVDEVNEEGAPIRPLAGAVHFAMHGTVMGASNTLLSHDAPGAMALAAEDAVGVPFLYLQGAAGDVAPTGGQMGHNGLQRIERIGVLSSSLIAGAFERAAPTAAPPRAHLRHEERRSVITREAVGYARGEYAEFGAVGCMFGASACMQYTAPEDAICLPLAKTPFAHSASLVAVEIEDLLLLTLPGEPTTAMAARIAAAAQALRPGRSPLVIGYAMDHHGYLLEQEDFLRAGYEPTVSPWGWKFDGFLEREVKALVSGLESAEPQPAAPLPELAAFDARAPTASLNSAAIVTQPQALRRTEVARFVFEGGDPALGTPKVALQRESSGAFAPVFTAGGRPVVNGPEIVLRYAADPTFRDDPAATVRRHLWTAEWETLPDTPMGTHRFVAKGRAAHGGDTAAYELTSAPFELSAADGCGAASSVTLSDAGSLVVGLRLPPNVPEYRNGGDPIAHYRLRDPHSRPQDGAPCRGGQVAATLTLPDATQLTRTLVYSEAAGGFVTEVPLQTGSYSVAIAPGALVDGLGNTNGAPVSAQTSR